MAITRDSDVDLNGTRYRGGVSSGGANTNLITMAHELAHVYGNAFDLYRDDKGNRQCNCSGATLMTETVNANFNSPLIHLDPFHRLIFGWLKPRVFDLSKYPPSKISLGLTRGGRPIENSKASFILYHSSLGFKEYFIIEYRTKGSEFDKGVVDNGVAIWHVRASQYDKFKDKDVKLISPNSSAFWDATDGPIKLKWANGRNVPVSINIDPSSENSKEVNLRLKPL